METEFSGPIMSSPTPIYECKSGPEKWSHTCPKPWLHTHIFLLSVIMFSICQPIFKLIAEGWETTLYRVFHRVVQSQGEDNYNLKLTLQFFNVKMNLFWIN